MRLHSLFVRIQSQVLSKLILFIHCRQHVKYIIYMFLKKSPISTPQPQTPTPPQQIQTQGSLTSPFAHKSMIVEEVQESYNLPLKLHGEQKTLQGTNLVQEYFIWNIQNPVSLEDPTIALELNMTALPNQKKRFLDIENMSTYLLNYGGTDFPTGVSLCCSQISGYNNEMKQATNVIATCAPLCVTPTLNAGGIIGYNVIYKNENNPIWDISNITTLTFRLKIFGDTTYRPLPSAQPLQVSAKISRVIF